MRALLVSVGLLLAAAVGGFFYVRAYPERVPPALVAYVAGLEGRLRGIRQDAAAQPASVSQRGGSAATTPATAGLTASSASPTAQAKEATPAAPSPFAPLEDPVTLYLRNGGVVTGELVRETPQEVVLHWEYGEVGFQRGEIRRMVQGKQDTDDDHMTMPWEGAHARWPYQYDVVIKLMRGTVVDARIAAVTPTAVTAIQTLDQGGQIEHTLVRADIEQLLFRPVRNARSEQIAENLRTVLPDMQHYEEGMFTIVTDSTGPTVKEYRRTIRELATEWYLTFHPLAARRAPQVQQYLVIFENWDAYMEYAASDGVPGWLVIGYFHPEEQVLYCFNMLGERFAEMLYDAYLGQFRKARDEISREIKGLREEVFIEGQISEFLQKLESAHSIVRQLFHQMSADLIRHELTHAMFHNWKLQGIILSQMSEKTKEELEKKRKYLQSMDRAEKRKLLDELLDKEAKAELPDMQAANSWFIEGLAGYMEPSPIGGINQERLAEIQEAHSRSQMLPLEFLNAFKIGSFRGMTTQSTLYAYAQSWAMCHFLMRRYPDAFLQYMDRLAREQPKADEDTLPWLIQATGKEQRALEQEFLDYLTQFPQEDPMWLKQWQTFIDLSAELETLVQRLWGRYY